MMRGSGRCCSEPQKALCSESHINLSASDLCFLALERGRTVSEIKVGIALQYCHVALMSAYFGKVYRDVVPLTQQPRVLPRKLHI
jgi:hypothetical protein